MAAAVGAALRAAGMAIEIAVTGAEALTQRRSFSPEIVLIDLDLPDVSGFTLVEQFASSGVCGVIVVSAFGDELTRIAGLETGADDYIVKPPVLRELAARIRAVHRRVSRRSAEPVLDTSTADSTLIVIDHNQRCLIGTNGERTLLTEAELSVLETLLDAEGANVSREWLSRVALKRPLHADDRSVDQLVLKLRRKIAGRGASDRVILSARRQGYVIPNFGQFRVQNTSAHDATRAGTPTDEKVA